jgi:LemA protein
MEAMGIALLAVVALAVLAAVGFFNRLVRLRIRCRGAWADVEAQLKRRWDLIPGVVEVVKGYAAHERGLLEQVAALRSAAMRPAGPNDRGPREGELSGAVRGLFALAEAYPDLKASASFLRLHGTLVEVEDQLQLARRYYNAVVRDYNTARELFPSSLIASAFRFAREEFFQLEDSGEAAAPHFTLNQGRR